MREIKYKVWLKKEKKMAEIVSINFELETVFIKIEDAMNYDVEAYDFREVELLQYTGLKDKYAKEIYEGDICIDEYDNRVGVVIWHKGCASLNNALNIRLLYSEASVLKVLGNRYEKPELLEKIDHGTIISRGSEWKYD